MSTAFAALATAALLGIASPPSRSLVAGPVLNGDRVLWGNSAARRAS
jgi:hypothetical protein